MTVIHRIAEVQFLESQIGVSLQEGKLWNWFYEVANAAGVDPATSFERARNSYLSVYIQGDVPETALIEHVALNDWLFSQVYCSEAKQELRLEIKAEQLRTARALTDALWRSHMPEPRLPVLLEGGCI